MSLSDITPEEVERTVATLLEAAEKERRTYLQSSAQEREREAAALAADADRLRALLGPEDPRVRALERGASGARAIAQWHAEVARRARGAPEIKRGDWTVVGRIVVPATVSGEGLVVQLVDREGAVLERLQARTDPRGEFVIQARAEEFADLLARQPEVLVRVTDPQGVVIATSTEPLRLQQDRVDYTEVAVREGPRPGGPAGPVRPTGPEGPVTRPRPRRPRPR